MNPTTSFNSDKSLYDVLDIKPDASPQEIREAYLRSKAAYNKDSAALYTLIDNSERDDMLQQIQEAYNVLSNTEKRREYDRRHGHVDPTESLREETHSRHHRKIISIDRVPPMESGSRTEDLLVAPSTDFEVQAPASSSDVFPNSSSLAEIANPGALLTPPPAPATRNETIQSRTQPMSPRVAEAQIEQEIAKEIAWRGEFLKKVREVRRISIEELSNTTKINRAYILAIENEDYTRLPAAVFLRGFLAQISKTLKLPHDAVVSSYMARFFEVRPDKRAK
jgi:hypothetical protein